MEEEHTWRHFSTAGVAPEDLVAVSSEWKEAGEMELTQKEEHDDDVEND